MISAEDYRHLDNAYSEKVAVPATAASPGQPGQIAYDSNYFYVCVSANIWLKVGIATWS